MTSTFESYIREIDDLREQIENLWDDIGDLRYKLERVRDSAKDDLPEEVGDILADAVADFKNGDWWHVLNDLEDAISEISEEPAGLWDVPIAEPFGVFL